LNVVAEAFDGSAGVKQAYGRSHNSHPNGRFHSVLVRRRLYSQWQFRQLKTWQIAQKRTARDEVIVICEENRMPRPPPPRPLPQTLSRA
jgi:hypothetical protein